MISRRTATALRIACLNGEPFALAPDEIQTLLARRMRSVLQRYGYLTPRVGRAVHNLGLLERRRLA